MTIYIHTHIYIIIYIYIIINVCKLCFYIEKEKKEACLVNYINLS